MKIHKVHLYGLRLPLKSPFIVSYERYDDMPVILTRLETDEGVIGWGEAVPDQHVTGETWESTFHVLKHELAPLIIGEEPSAIDRIHQLMDAKIKGVPAAKAAIDIAMYDIMGKVTNQPVYQLIGGKTHESLIVPQVISILEPDEMAREAKRIVSEGYQHVKMKVGTNPKKDVERIRAVSEAIPEYVALRVDANQGWSRSEALQVIEATKDCPVGWYEQPVAAEDFTSLAAIAQTVSANIMADESIKRAPDLLRLLQLGGVDFVNLKLMKTGGIYPALAVTRLADAAGIPCQVGSMVESAVGTMAGAHLCMAQSIIKSNEMVGPLMFSEDVAKTHYDGAVIHVPEKPGLGIDVDENYVRENAELKAVST